MNFKNIVTTTVMATAIVSAPVFAGASSKFAAHVAQAGTNLHLIHSGTATATVSGTKVELSQSADILNATIKTANKKDLLIGVSLQSGLYTDTTVKGKNGSSEKAGAEAGIKVSIEIDNGAIAVFPSEVIFASRVQELSATLGGVIESCEVSVDPNTGLGGFIVADDCIVSDEEIGLMISTTSANHFNFVAPDLGSGDHTIVVKATALSSAEFTNGTYTVGDLDQATCENDGGTWNGNTSECTFSTTNNEASAWALVDVGSLTVEEVRATNQEGGIVIDTDAGTAAP